MADERPRREEVRVAVDDHVTRRLLHGRGFHLEGRLRQARPRGDDCVDELVYARLASDPAGPEAHTYVMNSVTPRKRLIAHALVTDAHGHVLLCETSYKPDWELPGGIVEPGEPPREAAVREMVEEMGWGPRILGILVADWLRPYKGWEDALELVFATEPVSDADATSLHADGREIAGLHWLAPEDAYARMTPFGAGRLRTALRARAEGRTIYAEGGEPVA